MCEINAVVWNKPLKKGLFLEWMNKMAWSYKRNDDGIGATFISKNNIKVIKALDFKDFLSEKSKLIKWFYESYAVIGHTRLSTSGLEDYTNTQPIKKSDFIIIHNGVFSGLGNKKKSDTFELLTILQTNYIKKNNTIQAVKETLKNQFGTYSLFIINKNTRNLYYIKEEHTSIHFEKDKNGIWYISTRKGIYTNPIKTKKIHPYILYQYDKKTNRWIEKTRINRIREYGYTCCETDLKDKSTENNISYSDYYDLIYKQYYKGGLL